MDRCDIGDCGDNNNILANIEVDDTAVNIVGLDGDIRQLVVPLFVDEGSAKR